MDAWPRDDGDFGVELVVGRVYHGLGDVSTYGMQSLVGWLGSFVASGPWLPCLRLRSCHPLSTEEDLSVIP
jgi:hypothetical protein